MCAYYKLKTSVLCFHSWPAIVTAPRVSAGGFASRYHLDGKGLSDWCDKKCLLLYYVLIEYLKKLTYLYCIYTDIYIYILHYNIIHLYYPICISFIRISSMCSIIYRTRACWTDDSLLI